MLSLNYRSLFICAALFVMPLSRAVAQVPVSGYEIFIGHNCLIQGTPGTCGATFTGWTGGGTVWVPFPGTGQGAWSIQINYTGRPMFNGSVTVKSGKWSFLFFNGTEMRGKVLSGTVQWPIKGTSFPECGVTNAAIATATLSVEGGGTATVAGCLHDLPAGDVIPPTVWGAFTF